MIALDWDKLYLESIPTVLATESTGDYYKELMRLCARLGDGHTNVYAPAQTNTSAKPPLRTALIEGRVMILEALSPSLDAQGVRAGMEVVAVDGEPAVAYARREVEPYQSAGTRRIEIPVLSGTDFFAARVRNRSSDAARSCGRGKTMMNRSSRGGRLFRKSPRHPRSSSICD